MTNQNWVLAAQVHVPYSSTVNQVTFNNINSQTATDDTGSSVTLSAANAPIVRMFAKYQIHTSSSLGQTSGYSYLATTSQHDYAEEWCGPNQIGTLYSSGNSTGTGTASYYTTGAYWGYGAKPQHYSMYGWGDAITDPDTGLTVQPYDRRRQGVNVGCWEWYSTEQFYPVHQHWTMCCTDGVSDGSAATGNSEWGAYSQGCGGTNASYSTSDFVWYCGYNVSGTFLLYRSCNGNFQVNE